MSTAIQDARVFVGRVIGTAMFKTIKVKVFRKFLNPKTETTRVFMEKYLVHDPKEQCVIGDLVQIKECELMSPKKFFTLEDIIQKARRYTCPKTGQLYTTP